MRMNQVAILGAIPDLSYEQFVNFHATHYHPSNSTFFFYGDAPLDRELAFVQDNFLAKYPAAGRQSTHQRGRGRIRQPVFIEDTYPIQPGSSYRTKDLYRRQLRCGHGG
jgi:presequence protease